MTHSQSLPLFRGRARRPAQVLVVALSACMIAVGLPRPAAARPSLPRGQATADAAARAVSDTTAVTPPLLAMGASSGWSEPDSTKSEFPEEQKSHLARDLTAWIIGAVFVAFFIVEVFIKNDQSTPTTQKPPGKTIPTP